MISFIRFTVQVHHILSEIIQGGLVLDTNVEDIEIAGTRNPTQAVFHPVRALC